MSASNELLNDTMIKACRGEPVDHTPVWMMRQAGVVMPEYREMKKKHDFLTICRTPDLVAEVTLHPLDNLPKIDAVILFSDILVIPQGIGLGLEMVPSQGPVILRPIESPEDLETRILSKSISEVTENLSYVYEAVERTCTLLENRVPLIGFAGAPWTLMCYMVDGSGKEKQKEKFGISRKWLYEHPEASIKLLACLADHVAQHLIEQVRHGCHILQLFDTWAGILTPSLYRKFGIPTLQRVAERVKAVYPNVPIICFAMGVSSSTIETISHLPFDMISVDSHTELSEARKLAGGRVGIQGNMDPSALLASPEVIRMQVREMLEDYGSQQHYIANLGHGCLPEYKLENIGAFIDAVHDISRQMIEEKNNPEKIEK